MSQNRQLDAAWQYHTGTKHSYLRRAYHPAFSGLGQQATAVQDLSHAGSHAAAKGLPGHGHARAFGHCSCECNAGEAIADWRPSHNCFSFPLELPAARRFEGGETFFRAAACTGALYEIELYVVCRDLRSRDIPGSGIPAGVYHFGAAEFGLRQLRAGDFRRVLAEATASDPLIAHAPVTIICTGTYWRNAWKYRSRTYRHFGWDNGTILANLLAMCAATNFPASVVAGFVDLQVNSLLGLDTRREVAFSMVPVGHQMSEPPQPPEISPLDLPNVPYSKDEVDYPAMRRLHEASSFDSASEVIAWRGKTPDSGTRRRTKRRACADDGGG